MPSATTWSISKSAREKHSTQHYSQQIRPFKSVERSVMARIAALVNGMRVTPSAL
jgi:hypothetical protein